MRYITLMCVILVTVVCSGCMKEPVVTQQVHDAAIAALTDELAEVTEEADAFKSMLDNHNTRVVATLQAHERGLRREMGERGWRKFMKAEDELAKERRQQQLEALAVMIEKQQAAANQPKPKAPAAKPKAVVNPPKAPKKLTLKKTEAPVKK